jgi:hypothetical protein
MVSTEKSSFLCPGTTTTTTTWIFIGIRKILNLFSFLFFFSLVRISVCVSPFHLAAAPADGFQSRFQVIAPPFFFLNQFPMSMATLPDVLSRFSVSSCEIRFRMMVTVRYLDTQQ